MSNLTPDLYSASSNMSGAAGYGGAAYSEQGGVLTVNPAAYTAGSGGGDSLASKAIVGGGRKSGKSKKAKKAKKAKKMSGSLSKKLRKNWPRHQKLGKKTS